MIRKRLNIVFFSILMIAATPRVMSNFNGYADALYNKAETEWLRFLLAFSQPGGSEGSTYVAMPQHDASDCSLHTAKSDRPVLEKSTLKEKKNARVARWRDRVSDVAMTTSPTSPDLEKDSGMVEMHMQQAAQRFANRVIAWVEDPAAVERNGRSKTQIFKSLMRSWKRVDGKSMRPFGKDVPSIGKATPPPPVIEPVSSDCTLAPAVEPATSVAADETFEWKESTDDSILDAH